MRVLNWKKMLRVENDAELYIYVHGGTITLKDMNQRRRDSIDGMYCVNY